MSIALIESISQEVEACRACALYESAMRAVPGEGPADAAVMLIGEAPGAAEDRSGRPFVGASGRLLDTLLRRAGLERSGVYIANVVKHRPPDNRDPTPAEIRACQPFLRRQIAAIDPQVIVPLGRHAAKYWIPTIHIALHHGRVFRVDGRLVVPMFHPAAALYQRRNLPLLEADFAQLGVYLRDGFPAES
jgi:uracil-DNA glycosylase family 4